MHLHRDSLALTNRSEQEELYSIPLLVIEARDNRLGNASLLYFTNLYTGN